MSEGKVRADSLFLGLTRPSMIFGVSYLYATLNGVLSLLAFIITSKFIYLMVVMPVLHTIAYLICLKEPMAIEMFLVKTRNFSFCPNRLFHKGMRSYDVY